MHAKRIDFLTKQTKTDFPQENFMILSHVKSLYYLMDLRLNFFETLS